MNKIILAGQVDHIEKHNNCVTFVLGVFHCVIFDKQGDTLLERDNESLTLIVEGRMQINTKEYPDGKRFFPEVVCSRFEFLK